MIRDPSDGTVREIVVDEKVGKSNLKPKTSHVDNDLMSSTTSGLRQPTRTDAQLRLERSREWLKAYHANNGATHAGADIGEEFQAAWHSVEGQRAAKPASSA